MSSVARYFIVAVVDSALGFTDSELERVEKVILVSGEKRVVCGRFDLRVVDEKIINASIENE